MRPSGKRDAAVAAKAAIKEKGKTGGHGGLKKDGSKSGANDGEDLTPAEAASDSSAEKDGNKNQGSSSTEKGISSARTGDTTASPPEATGKNKSTPTKSEGKITIKTTVGKALTRSKTRSLALLKHDSVTVSTTSTDVQPEKSTNQPQSNIVTGKENPDPPALHSSPEKVTDESLSNIPVPEKQDVSEIQMPPPIKTEDVPLPEGSPKALVSPTENADVPVDVISSPKNLVPDKSKECIELNKGSVCFSISKIPNKISVAPSAFNQDEPDLIEVVPSKPITIVENTEEIGKDQRLNETEPIVEPTSATSPGTATVVNPRLLENFVKVKLAKETAEEIDWPVETIKFTKATPSIHYSCNPLQFNFKDIYKCPETQSPKLVDANTDGVKVDDAKDDFSKVVKEGDGEDVKANAADEDKSKVGGEKHKSRRKHSRKKHKHKKSVKPKEGEPKAEGEVKKEDDGEKATEEDKGKEKKKKRKKRKRRHKSKKTETVEGAVEGENKEKKKSKRKRTHTEGEASVVEKKEGEEKSETVVNGEKAASSRRHKKHKRKHRKAGSTRSDKSKSVGSSEKAKPIAVDSVNAKEPKVKIDYNDEEEVHDQSELEPGACEEPKVKRFRHSNSKKRRAKRNEGHEQGESGKLDEALKPNKKGNEEEKKTSDAVSLSEPLIAKKELTPAETANKDGAPPTARTPNGDLSAGRKRSASISEGVTPVKIAKTEKTDEDTWSKMEGLYEHKEEGEGTKSKWDTSESEGEDVLKKTLTPTNNGPTSLSDDDKSKLDLKPINGKISMSKKLVTQNSITGNHVIKPATQPNQSQHNSTELSKTKSDADNNNKDGSINTKSQREPRSHHRNSRHSFSSSDWSSRSRSRSRSARSRSDSYRSYTDESRYSDDSRSPSRSSRSYSRSRSRHRHHRRSSSRRHRSNSYTSRSSSSWSRSRSYSHSRSYSRSLSRSRSRSGKSRSSRNKLRNILKTPVLTPSVTTLTVVPVTGTTTGGKSGTTGSSSGGNGPPEDIPLPQKDSSAATTVSPVEKEKKEEAGLIDIPLPDTGEKSKTEVKEVSSGPGTSVTASITNSVADSLAVTTLSTAAATDGTVVAADPLMGSLEQGCDASGYDLQGYNASDPSFCEDSYDSCDFDGWEYDQGYDEGQEEYDYNHDPYHHPPLRQPGMYPRMRGPPMPGYRGPPPRMFPPHDPRFGPRPGMGPRMGPNGPMGPRGPRPPMGPMGMRMPLRGPPRGPPGPRFPPGMHGMRGPPRPGMMGPLGPMGQGGPRLRMGPPRMGPPMPGQGPRSRMGPPGPMSGPPLRDGQYPPPRAGMPPYPRGPGARNPLLNLSQPPPNFPGAGTSGSDKSTDSAEPPPLPPPKPPTPQPPPPPKKEEIKPMAPLIPPEQAEQYRKLQEQAQKHAKKQQRKQEHQAKGEPESSDEDEEEEAKKKEDEARLAAEQKEMEEAALQVVEEVNVEGTTILMPATQSPLVQQPTVVIQHPVAAPQAAYGLVSTPHLIHPSQLHHQHLMASAQPQLVQLSNGQVVYATPSSLQPYQAGHPVIAMPHHHAMPMAQHLIPSGAMHAHPQVQMAAHPGIAVTNAQYVTHMMAAQAQAQAQAHAHAQAVQAQAVQIQAAQAQAAQAQSAQFHGLVPGMHHVAMPSVHHQGQFILVPRIARPHI